MLRRPRIAIIAIFGLCAFVAFGFTNCRGPWKTGEVDFTGIPETVQPGQKLAFRVTYRFKPTSDRPNDRPCIAAIGIVWRPGPTGESRDVLWTAKRKPSGPCPMTQSEKVFATVPSWFRGGSIDVEVTTQRVVMDVATGYYYAGATMGVAVSAAGPDPAAGQTPTPRLMQVQMPVASVGNVMQVTFPGLVDARNSSDPAGGTLSYSWDLNGDGVYGDDTEAAYRTSGTYPVAATLPPGMAWIAPGAAYNGQSPYPTVSVKVTSSVSKLSATASTSIRVTDIGSGMVSYGQVCGAPEAGAAFSPGGMYDFCLWSPITATAAGVSGTGGFDTVACVDANEDGVYGDPVANWSSVPYANNEVLLTSQPWNNRGGVNVRFVAPVTAGWHVMRAIVWDPSMMTAGCATPLLASVHETPGVLSQLAALYYVSTGGEQGRQSGGFTAKTALRLGAGAAVAEGTLTSQATITGLVMRGTYRLPTPATSKGVKRPAGLAAIAAGDYVIRTEGVSITGTSDWIGPATMLMRGRDGTLACHAVVGDPGKSSLTLLGGTGQAGRLVMTSTGPALKMTGGKPPANPSAAKKAKGKPSSFRGSVTASTGTKSRALPATCSSLKRYLP